MLDFNSKSKISDRINYYIDSALELEQSLQPQRAYLGGSRLGVECERALQYEFLKTPTDLDPQFPGRILRIFERGHWIESAMIEWLKKSGFGLIEGTKDGRQFGFEEHDGVVKGHCDGVIVAGPIEFGPWPRLWENKGINERSFKQLEKDKVQIKYPVYFGQMQYYMEKFHLEKNPALFSAVNMNTMDIYWESVEYNPDYVYLLDEKAKRIILACKEGELLPRASRSKTSFKCKFCDWRKRCWSV